MNEQEARPKRRRNRAEAAQLVAEYEASGLNRTEFCRRQGLSLNTFHRYCQWLHRAQGDGVVPTQPFVAVEVRRDGSSPSGLRLLLTAGTRIEVDAGFDPDTLVRLLRVLERL